MKNKLIVVIAMLAMMVAMTGIAAAGPEFLDWSVSSPMYLQNDGITQNTFNWRFYDYDTNSVAGQVHTLKAYVSAVAPALVTDLTMTVCERDTPANCVTLIGPTSAIPITLTWNQLQAGSTVGEQDFIDVSIISSGADGANYRIYADDVGYSIQGSTDSAAENLQGINVPEFPAIALPVAGVLGLVLFFQQRKIKGSK
jgi:hypothetical protein